MPHDGGGAEAILAEFVQAGVGDAELATQLQREGVQVFANSWHALLDCIAQKALQ